LRALQQRHRQRFVANHAERPIHQDKLGIAPFRQ
jgi:hypothetical protein